MLLALLRCGCLLTVLWTALSPAQTRWPDYMPGLEPAHSESPRAAVLPEDLIITPPAPGLPQTFKRWSGTWHGWACRGWSCDIKIAIEKVSTKGVVVVYARAHALEKSRHDRATGTFEGDEVSVRLPTGARLALRLRSGGEMEVSIWGSDGSLGSAGVVTQASLNYVREVVRVATPWSGNGKPLTLEMVTYRPRGEGPFPTVVFNHGSTGSGSDPKRFKYTTTSLPLARFFVDRGWQVLFPQRRGRGNSDGLYDEGFKHDRSRYSCSPGQSLPGADRAVADLDAVMAHLQTQPAVDSKRLLIGGASRGGILSVVYAGVHPQRFRGVINFVGGWIGDQCPNANKINPVLFKRGAAFDKATLWLYGDEDPYYSLAHSRQNFDVFEAAGGQGRFHSFDAPPNQSGHDIVWHPALWGETVDAYLDGIGLR